MRSSMEGGRRYQKTTANLGDGEAGRLRGRLGAAHGGGSRGRLTGMTHGGIVERRKMTYDSNDSNIIVVVTTLH